MLTLPMALMTSESLLVMSDRCVLTSLVDAAIGESLLDTTVKWLPLLITEATLTCVKSWIPGLMGTALLFLFARVCDQSVSLSAAA